MFTRHRRADAARARDLELAKQLSLSVIWALYGAGLLLAGGVWRVRLLRLMALGLLCGAAQAQQLEALRMAEQPLVQQLAALGIMRESIAGLWTRTPAGFVTGPARPAAALAADGRPAGRELCPVDLGRPL